MNEPELNRPQSPGRPEDPMTDHPAPTAPSAPTTPAERATTGGYSAPAAKADLAKRVVAVIIDAAIAAVLGVIPVVGGIIGTAYIVVRDGLDVDFMPNRSLGKKLMNLQPVRLDGAKVDLETSFRRNWMFGLGALISLLLYIPIIGWILIPIVGLASLGIGLYEIYLVVTDAEGRRWGDRMAGTKVIEVAS